MHHFKEKVIDAYKDDPNTYFIDLGDGLDLMIPQTGDRRYQASMMDERYVGVDNPVDLAINDYVELLTPIKDRILAMVQSNHHLSLLGKTGTDPTKRIGWLLWGPDAEKRLHGYAGFLRLAFYAHVENPTPTKSPKNVKKSIGYNCQSQIQTWYISHGIGTGGGRTLGGAATSLGNVAKGRRADVYCFAHNHQLSVNDNIQLGVDKADRIISVKQTILNTGCYKKSRSDDQSVSWEEKMEFPANALGHIEVTVRHSQPRIHKGESKYLASGKRLRPGQKHVSAFDTTFIKRMIL